MTSGRVLLLETDRTLHELLQALLAGEGLEVVSCASLLDVLGHATGAPGELALVDFWRSGRSADDEQDRACLQRVGRLVPLVIVTDQAVAQQLTPEAVGATTILPKPKPFDLEALLGAVEHALQPRTANSLV